MDPESSVVTEISDAFKAGSACGICANADIRNLCRMASSLFDLQLELDDCLWHVLLGQRSADNTVQGVIGCIPLWFCMYFDRSTRSGADDLRSVWPVQPPVLPINNCIAATGIIQGIKGSVTLDSEHKPQQRFSVSAKHGAVYGTRLANEGLVVAAIRKSCIPNLTWQYCSAMM